MHYHCATPAFFLHGKNLVPWEGIEPPTRGSSERFFLNYSRDRTILSPRKNAFCHCGGWALRPTYVGLLPFGIVSTPSPMLHRGLARDCPATMFRISPNSPNFSPNITTRGPEVQATALPLSYQGI